MKRLVFQIAIIVCLTLTWLAGAYATGNTMTDGSLYIELEYDGKALPDIGMDIYLIATVSEKQGGGIEYTVSRDFAGANLSIPADGYMTAGDNRIFSDAMIDYARKNGISPLYSNVSNLDGRVSVADMTPGYYLISQSLISGGIFSGYDDKDYIVSPSMIPVPFYNGTEWYNDIIIRPKTEIFMSVDPEPTPTPTPTPTPKPTPTPTPTPTPAATQTKSPPPPPGVTVETPAITARPTPQPVITATPTEPAATRSPAPHTERTARPPQSAEPTTPAPAATEEPKEGDTYLEFGDDGAPIGIWRYDPERGWVYEEFNDDAPPQAAAKIPQTGMIRWPIPILCIFGGIFLAAGIIVIRKGIVCRQEK